jgi:hypothetical protein
MHQDREWVRADRQLDRMMLGRPGDLEATLLRHPDQFQRVPCHLPHILVRMAALHIDGD